MGFSAFTATERIRIFGPGIIEREKIVEIEPVDPARCPSTSSSRKIRLVATSPGFPSAKKFAEADQLLTRSLTNHPLHAWALPYSAYAELQLKKFEDALVHARKSP